MKEKALLGLALGLLLVGGKEASKGPFYYEREYTGPNFSLGHRNILISEEKSVFTAQVTLKNTGRKRARDVVLNCWLEREHDVVTKTSTTLDRVLAGREKVVDCPLGKLGPGVYYLKVKELWDKRSDFSMLTFRVAGANLRTLPQHVWVMPIAPWPGEGFTVRMGILNDGEEDAHDVSVSVTVDDLAGKPVGPSVYFKLDQVRAGDEVSKEVQMPGLSSGSYHLVVRVNTDEAFKEVFDKDNRTVKLLKIWKPLTSFTVSPKPVSIP